MKKDYNEHSFFIARSSPYDQWSVLSGLQLNCLKFDCYQVAPLEGNMSLVGTYRKIPPKVGSLCVVWSNEKHKYIARCVRIDAEGRPIFSFTLSNNAMQMLFDNWETYVNEGAEQD